MNDLVKAHIGPASRLLKALANEHRLAILCQLGQGEMCVGELAETVGLSQSALSQHLAKLRAEGLVRTRRRAQTIFYAVASPEAAAIIDTLSGLYCPAGKPIGPIALENTT